MSKGNYSSLICNNFMKQTGTKLPQSKNCRVQQQMQNYATISKNLFFGESNINFSLGLLLIFF